MQHDKQMNFPDFSGSGRKNKIRPDPVLTERIFIREEHG